MYIRILPLIYKTIVKNQLEMNTLKNIYCIVPTRAEIWYIIIDHLWIVLFGIKSKPMLLKKNFYTLKYKLQTNELLYSTLY